METMYETPVLAVIGGSGLYNFKELRDIQTIEVDTPFGQPSSPITIGKLSGKPVAFLAPWHWSYFPTQRSPISCQYLRPEIPGDRRIVSVSACGSLRESFAPGHIVIPNQIFDFTHLRQRSFLKRDWSPMSALLIRFAKRCQMFLKKQ